MAYGKRTKRISASKKGGNLMHKKNQMGGKARDDAAVARENARRGKAS